VQYKAIIKGETEKWHEGCADDIRKWLEKRDAQLWKGIRNVMQVRKEGYKLDPKRVREYFQGLLGRERSQGL
jgi:hypothetical protein